MSENSLIQHSKKWDRSGIIVSSLCLSHCLALPFIMIALPVSFEFLENEWIEVGLFSMGIFIGSYSFVTSFNRHRRLQPMLVGATGVAFLCWSLYSGLVLEVHSFYYSIVGGALLVAGHIWNIKACNHHGQSC